MKKLIILLLIFYLLVQFSVLSAQTQIKTQNISLINNGITVGVGKDLPYQLLYGNTEYSFDKLNIISETKALAYDKWKAEFIFIDLKNKTILDKLSILNEKYIIRKKGDNRKYVFCDFSNTCTFNDAYNEDYYFTPYNNTSAISKLNDTTFFIGFFKLFETKKYNTQFNIILSNNKLKSEYNSYPLSFFKDYLNSKFKTYSNLTANSKVFSFQKNTYLFSTTNHTDRSGVNEENRIFNIIARINKNKASIIYKEKKGVLREVTFFVGGVKKILKIKYSKYRSYNFLEFDSVLIQYQRDTMIVWDCDFNIIHTCSIEENNKNAINKTFFYTDAKTKELYRIIEFCLDSKSYLYKINNLDINKDTIKYKNSKILLSNKKLSLKGITNHKLITTSKNPLYNTDYIQIIKLDFFDDTLQLNFQFYNKIAALKYQFQLRKYEVYKYSYDKMKNKIFRDFNILNDKQKVKIKNKSIPELFLSTKKLLNTKSYIDLVKNVLVYEKEELKAYDYYKQQNIIKHFKTPINRLYIDVLEKDIDELIKNYQTYNIDFSNNLSFFKTSSNHIYTIVRIKNKYYFNATIGYESKNLEIPYDNSIFGRKFKYLKYKEISSTANIVSFYNQDSNIVSSPLGAMLSFHYFPGIIENPDLYPQKTIRDLFKSMRKCFEETNIKYMQSELTTYPIDFINKLKNENIQNPFLVKSTKIEQEINNLFLKNQYEKKRISRKIYAFRFKLNDTNYEIIVIKHKKKWYIYPLINIY